ncbi:MAG: extracellular solute-binding protein [Oscillospiraceae bacterium]|nr:extracellular solute-binding protein [Oscillospiraceae bacterium]
MKKFISLILIFSLLLALCGCHGAQEEKVFVIPETFDTSRQFEITFWAKNDTNMTQVNIYKAAIAEFEALYPNIKVNLRLYTDYGKIYNDVITNIATDTTPNVCITYPDHIATYLTGADTVVPLDDLFTHSKYGLGGSDLRFDGPTVDEIIPQFLAECQFNGYYYAIPYMRSTEACYVNKTYVEKLGFTLPEQLTWDFIWEVSEAAMQQDAEGNFLVNGQKVLIPFMYKSTDNMMIQMLRQQNAGYSTSLGEVHLFNDTTRQLLYTIAEHSATKAFNTFKSSGYPANFLNAGQCIFAIDSTAGATWMGSNAPLIDIAPEKLVQFETVVMTVPQFDPQNPQMISQGPSMCVFNKEDPQEVLASWLFAQYMLTNTVQISYAQTEGYCPVTSKAQQSPEYLDYLSRRGENNDLYYDIKIDATLLLLNNTANTFVTPVFNGSASVRNAAGQLIEEVKRSARRGEVIDEAYLDALFAEMIALYRLDQISASSGKVSFGPLPSGSRVLIGTLALCWLCMGIYVGANWLKKKKHE